MRTKTDITICLWPCEKNSANKRERKVTRSLGSTVAEAERKYMRGKLRSTAVCVESRIRFLTWSMAGSGWRLGCSQWCRAEGADVVTRERANTVVEAQTWSGSTGLSRLHTSMYYDDIGRPPILIFMLTCTSLFFDLLAFIASYLSWCWQQQRNTQKDHHALWRTSPRPSR